jgi:hypothetical protein
MKQAKTRAVIEPPDPHAAWWLERQRLAADHERRYLICEQDADDEHERRFRRLDELEHLIRNTSVTTFEGFRVQLRALSSAIEDGLDHDDLKEALSSLDDFVGDLERALERQGLKEQAQRWCREMRGPSAPASGDHPGKPADAKGISRAARPTRGAMGAAA